MVLQDLGGGDHGVVVHMADRVRWPTPILTPTPVYKLKSFKLKFRILGKIKFDNFQLKSWKTHFQIMWNITCLFKDSWLISYVQLIQWIYIMFTSMYITNMSYSYMLIFRIQVIFHHKRLDEQTQFEVNMRNWNSLNNNNILFLQ